MAVTLPQCWAAEPSPHPQHSHTPRAAATAGKATLMGPSPPMEANWETAASPTPEALAPETLCQCGRAQPQQREWKGPLGGQEHAYRWRQEDGGTATDRKDRTHQEDARTEKGIGHRRTGGGTTGEEMGWVWKKAQVEGIEGRRGNKKGTPSNGEG